jgi:2-polyprenyl-3-methyl-5-hydroxy-6-metoxy-1,4-benzoquinol methylase
MTTSTPASFDEARRDAFVGRLFTDTIAAMETLSVYLGDRLELYRHLHEGGPATPGELASRAGIHERYAREWLEQQAVAGILDVDSPASEGSARRYALPAEHAEPLLEPTSLNYLAPFSRMVAGVARPLDELLHAYRTGGGVRWEAFGADTREGQAGQNRPVFDQLLVGPWLETVPEVRERLEAGPSRIADIAFGGGWSSIALARRFPQATIDGYDLDEASVELATRNAQEAGVADRVRFHLHDASDSDLAGEYDLVTVFEALHDMSRPVEALANMRRLAGSRGTVLVMDENVAEEFTAPGDEVERIFYAFSVLLCLPDGMSHTPTAATGTVMRPSILRSYASEAGFASVEVLPVGHDFFRLYRLHP